MSDEDKLAQWMIESRPNETHAVEVHYNHYGDRGIVDLVSESDPLGDEKPYLRVYELKSDRAIEEATGANEIIRQFNRQREYFMCGSNYDESDYIEVMHLLGFYASKTAIDHILQNEELYRTLSGDGLATNIHLYYPGIEQKALPLIDSDDEPFANYDKFEHIIGGVMQ